jgi:hypothetical protein
MGVDLISDHGEISFNWAYWGRCLEIAKTFGWSPAGTIAAEEFIGDWSGTYFTNDQQIVTDDDARSLAIALYRAATALMGKKLTQEQAGVCGDITAEALFVLADYAVLGGFMIL